jgi:hypothetical protein
MNVAIIEMNDLNLYNNLSKKLNLLRKQCNFNDINYSCWPYDTCKAVYYILYIGIEFDKSNYNFFTNPFGTRIEKDVEIVSHLKVIYGSVYNELYDVCVENGYRNKKITTNLIRQIIELPQNKNKPFWLGVDISNPYFSAAIKSYLNAGFGSPQLKNHTPNGTKLDFWIVELTTNNSSVNLIENMKRFISGENTKLESDFKLSNELGKFQNYVLNHTCEHTYIIESDLTNILYDLLYEKVEVAGVFNKYKHDKSHSARSHSARSHSSVIELIYNTNSQIIGDDQEYTVNLPDSEYSFHVHPNICLTEFKCFISWPSSVDMRTLVLQYIYGSLRLHFVITPEGIYSMSLTPEFQYFLSVLKFYQTEFEYIFPILEENIFQLFWDIENYRKEHKATSEYFRYDEVFELSELEKEIISKHYNQIVNLVTIADIFNPSYSPITQLGVDEQSIISPLEKYNHVVAGLNFTLFHVNLWKWDDIHKNNRIKFKYGYISEDCSISSTVLNNYIEMMTK